MSNLATNIVPCGDKRRFIGAVAGAVVIGDAEKNARENGMYVIVQSGNAVEIVTQPENSLAKVWEQGTYNIK